VAHPLLQELSRLEMKGRLMKRYLLLLLIVMTQSGCAFLGGAATGAVAAGAGYEIQAKRQMDRLDEDLKNRRISREEYEDRRQQIQKGSIIY
jgi:ribulose kinase